MSKTIVVSGASSGFGAMTVRALANAGHTVYGGMRATTSRNRKAVEKLRQYAATQGVRAQAVEMDVGE
jgi:NAD(P)-dependent dehydrogenase (short-subunit alcohol dehydrogenase family)